MPETKVRRETGTEPVSAEVEKSHVGDEHYKILRKFSESLVANNFLTGDDDSVVRNIGNKFKVLEPEYDLSSLLKLPYQNNTLLQCITAYVDNIDGAGYTLEFIGEEGKEEDQDVLDEKDKIESLLNYPNADGDFLEVRRKARMDKEFIGYECMEILYNLQGEISGINHVKSHLIRKTKRDKDATEVEIYNNITGEFKKVKKHFRRYVQRVGNKFIYFKELGDPRNIDAATGEEMVGKDNAGTATSLLMTEIYSTGHIYGLPRWINQLPSVLGSRECELTNMDFFSENAIPAMAVMVSGGALSSESVNNIEDTFDKNKGRKSMNKVLVIEALGDSEAADDAGRIPPPKIEMKPLASARQSDTLFENYDEKAGIKIRSSFKLPPIFVGKTEDYTYATASASVAVVNNQVFSPKKKKTDKMINYKLLVDSEGKPPQFWRYRTTSLPAPADTDVNSIIVSLNSVGAMTPNIAIGLVNKMSNTNISIIDKDWANQPFSFTIQERGAIPDDPKINEAIKIVSESRISSENKQKVLDIFEPYIAAA